MRRKVVVVVDAVSTGTALAAPFRAYGYCCLHVMSSPAVNGIYGMVASHHDFVATYDFASLAIKGIERELAKFDVEFAIAGTDSGIEIADLLSERLNLPKRNDFALSGTRRDKFLMIDRVRAMNLPAPWQFKANSLEEAISNLELQSALPVVVKPARSYGTDGVTVCYSPQQFREAVEKALLRTSRYAEGNRYVVVQEYLQGDEYHVDTVSCDGFHKMIAIWKGERKRCGAPFVYKTTLVSRQEEHEEIESYVRSVLGALGVSWGPANTDVMWTPTGPTLIELNARLHGSLESLPVSLAIGTNQPLETAKAYIDPDGFMREVCRPTKLRNSCAKVYLISPLRGILKQEPKWDLLEKLPSYRGVVKKYYVGKEVTPTADMLTTPGIVFLTSNSDEELMKDYGAIRELEKDGFYSDLV